MTDQMTHLTWENLFIELHTKLLEIKTGGSLDQRSPIYDEMLLLFSHYSDWVEDSEDNPALLLGLKWAVSNRRAPHFYRGTKGQKDWPSNFWWFNPGNYKWQDVAANALPKEIFSRFPDNVRDGCFACAETLHQIMQLLGDSL